MNIAASLADSFKSMAVARAYGEPVQVGSETLVPVALVQAGFGGGGDADGDGGGGGGGLVLPLGVYAGKEGSPAVFRPNPVALIGLDTDAGDALVEVSPGDVVPVPVQIPRPRCGSNLVWSHC